MDLLVTVLAAGRLAQLPEGPSCPTPGAGHSLSHSSPCAARVSARLPSFLCFLLVTRTEYIDLPFGDSRDLVHSDTDQSVSDDN